MDPTFNPFGQSAIGLNQYVQAARPQIARMLGMTGMSPPAWGSNFGMPSYNAGDFNKSFGDLGGPPSPQQQNTPQNPGPPLDLSPPNPGPSSPDTSQRSFGPIPDMGNPVRPNPLSPSYNLNMGPAWGRFVDAMSNLGERPDAGILPRLFYLGNKTFGS